MNDIRFKNGLESMVGNPEKAESGEGLESLESKALKIGELRDEKDVIDFFRQSELVAGVKPEKLDAKVNWLTRDYFKSDGTVRILGIKSEGDVLAGVAMSVEEDWGIKKAYLYNSFVDAGMRGKNLNSDLIVKSLEIAKQENCKQAYAFIQRDNLASLISYTRSGFSISSSKHPRVYEGIENAYVSSIDLQEQGDNFTTEMIGSAE